MHRTDNNNLHARLRDSHPRVALRNMPPSEAAASGPSLASSSSASAMNPLGHHSSAGFVPSPYPAGYFQPPPGAQPGPAVGFPPSAAFFPPQYPVDQHFFPPSTGSDYGLQPHSGFFPSTGTGSGYGVQPPSAFFPPSTGSGYGVQPPSAFFPPSTGSHYGAQPSLGGFPDLPQSTGSAYGAQPLAGFFPPSTSYFISPTGNFPLAPDAHFPLAPAAHLPPPSGHNVNDPTQANSSAETLNIDPTIQNLVMSRSVAAEVPADIVSKIKNGGVTGANAKRLSTVINASNFTTPAEWFNNAEAKRAEFHRDMHPSQERKMKFLQIAWIEYTQGMLQMPLEKAWWGIVVRKGAPDFLRYLITTSKARSKVSTALKSSTLFGWFVTFTKLIVRYARDGTSAQCVGMKLLVDDGLYMTLRLQVGSLTREFSLDRYLSPKLYCGRREVAMMVSTAIQAPRGRRYKIHAIMKLLLPFHTSCRPSTLGPYVQEFKDDGLYPVLEDIKLRRHRELGGVEAHVTYKHFKGYNEVEGTTQIHVLCPVKNFQNLLFCAATMIAVDLFLRGALENCATIDDVINGPEEWIKIKPSMLKQPLFPKLKAGGQRCHADPPTQPATASSFTTAIANLSVQAGLPKMSIYTLRRSTLDFYCEFFGNALAKRLANHKLDVFDKHYGRGTANYNSVAMRTGEVKGTRKTDMLLWEKESVSCAIDALVSQSRNHEQVLFTQAKEAIDESEHMKELEQECLEVVEKYLDCFDRETVPLMYMNPAQLRYGIVPFHNKASTGVGSVILLDDKRNEAEAFKNDIISCRDRIVAFRKLETRRILFASRARRTTAHHDKTVNPTVQETDEAKKKMDEYQLFFTAMKDLSSGTGAPESFTLPAMMEDEEDDSLAFEDEDDGEEQQNAFHFRQPQLQALESQFAAKHGGDDFSFTKGMTGSSKTQAPPNIVSTTDDSPLEDADPELNEADAVPDAFKHVIDIKTSRLEWMKMLVAPVKEENKSRKTQQSGSKTCPECVENETHPLRHKDISVNITHFSHLNRHNATVHSDWNKLYLSMDVDLIEDQVYCPGEACSFRTTYYDDDRINTVKTIREHCLTDACPNHDTHRTIFDEHHRAMAEQRYEPDKTPSSWGNEEMTGSSKRLILNRLAAIKQEIPTINLEDLTKMIENWNGRVAPLAQTSSIIHPTSPAIPQSLSLSVQADMTHADLVLYLYHVQSEGHETYNHTAMVCRWC